MYPAPYESHNLTMWKLLSGAALVMALTLPMPAHAQNTSSTPKIKHQEISYVSPASGKQMYEAYCATCHGVNGKGTAAAVTALTPPPTDLTLLSSHNAGQFPAYRIRDLLLDQDLYHDRAGDNMPVWVPAFMSLQRNHPDLVRLRVQNLVAYLETMQASPGKAGTDPGSSANPR